MAHPAEHPKPFTGYTVEWLMVGLLTSPVDNGIVRYQRNQGKGGKPGTGLKARFKKYGTFNPAFVRFREVSRRGDGTLACMDGNGSNHWMQGQFGYEFLVPCKVYEGLSEAQEARMFLGFQRTKSVTRTEEFNAGQITKDEQYIKTGQIAADYGFAIGNGRNNKVIGYSAIEYVFKFGETRLRETLQYVRDSYPDDQSRTNTGFVMALCDVLGNADIDRGILDKVLAGVSVDDLRENRSGGAAKTTCFNNIMELYRAQRLLNSPFGK